MSRDVNVLLGARVRVLKMAAPNVQSIVSNWKKLDLNALQVSKLIISSLYNESLMLLLFDC